MSFSRERMWKGLLNVILVYLYVINTPDDEDQGERVKIVCSEETTVAEFLTKTHEAIIKGFAVLILSSADFDDPKEIVDELDWVNSAIQVTSLLTPVTRQEISTMVVHKILGKDE